MYEGPRRDRAARERETGIVMPTPFLITARQFVRFNLDLGGRRSGTTHAFYAW